MTQRVEEVTEENSRLHLELRKNLEAQIQAATQSGSKSAGRADVGDMLNTLQQQLDMVTKDRDTFQDLLRKTSHELDLCRQRDQVRTEKWDPDIMIGAVCRRKRLGFFSVNQKWLRLSKQL